MRDVLAGQEGVYVSRPVKVAEVRLRGLEKSITGLRLLSP